MGILTRDGIPGQRGVVQSQGLGTPRWLPEKFGTSIADRSECGVLYILIIANLFKII